MRISFIISEKVRGRGNVYIYIKWLLGNSPSRRGMVSKTGNGGRAPVSLVEGGFYGYDQP